jgi:hypothetical protein
MNQIQHDTSAGHRAGGLVGFTLDYWKPLCHIKGRAYLWITAPHLRKSQHIAL